MKITNTLILKLAALFILGCAAACGSNTPTNTAVNSPANQAANTAQTENKTSVENKNVSPETNKTESNSSSKSGSLATPTEAYKFAYAARQNKDTEGLKRVLSKTRSNFSV